MKRIKKPSTVPVAPPADSVEPPRPAPIARRDWEYTRLRVGDVIELYGSKYVVDYVNSCRARCIPLSKKQVSYTTVAGKTVEFESEQAGKNISPNSEIPILKRLGPDWRKIFDKTNNQTESEQ